MLIVYIIRHVCIDIEKHSNRRPGTIEDYLVKNGISYKIVGLEKEGIPDPKFRPLL